MAMSPFPFPPIDKDATPEERRRAYERYRAELTFLGASNATSLREALLGALIIVAVIALIGVAFYSATGGA
jgi:hypothetical protein